LDYFTQEQFKTLEKYAGIKKDNANAQHIAGVNILKEAYELNQTWAEKVQQKCFQQGDVKLRKSPINQAGNFAEYTWAKIYPKSESPKELAFTVGINSEGFTVKIDTVNVDSSLRKKYESVRGDYSASPIVSSISVEAGLAMTMEQLVDWSINQIAEFNPTLEDVANKIGLSQAKATHPATKEHSYLGSDRPRQPMSLNQIFYGPPGTGKTYHTIEAAVSVAEPEFSYETRKQLKAKYDELVTKKRIRFVTFHQSYGYEEFVEGLRANSEDGAISYDVEPGIFKQVCEQAALGVEADQEPLAIAIGEFLLAIESSSQIELQTQTGKKFTVTYRGNKTLRVFPQASVNEKLDKGYAVSIDNIKKLYRGAALKTLYNPSYVKAILNHLITDYKVNPFKDIVGEGVKNFVLIIDEINRGNISKIFGELITLIEDSKRAHPSNTEALEVILPNSGDLFSVPSNLYLIGTMNTADRSLAMMDTALRRRFSFLEMMPNPYLFDGILVEGISLTKLLLTMNRRIEALYDREHTLGHAFFVPVMQAFESGDEQRAFEELKSVFTNKVIPLLKEYFFDDWNKIRLVLGDNQKPEYLQFVTQDEVPYQNLFGDNHGLDTYEQAQNTYSLVSHIEEGSVWDKPAAYQAIYNPDSV
jgi:5-methylcytosine-specific restriction protein B